jgi:Protein of unknown function (DUF3108)
VLSLLRRAAPLLWYVALAVLVTWPLVAHPLARLGALHGAGDPYLNLWILGWDLQTLSRSPLAMLNGAAFDAPIFHPASQTLAYSDHLLPIATLVWPVYWASGSSVLAYNTVLIGSLVGSALAMHLLARRVTGSTVGALAAGTIWGFWPYHTAHLGHLQLQATYAMPLAFLALHRLVAGTRARDALVFGAAAAFMAATSVYYGVIGAVGLGVSAVLLTIGTGGRRAGRLVKRFALAGVIGAVLVAPLVWPYWQVQQREGFVRNLYEASRHAATPASYVSAPAVNLLYGSTGVLRTDRGAESELFPGFTVLGLAGLGLAVARRRGSWPLALSAIGLIVTGALLSLGPDGVRPLYALLHRFVFGFQAIRAPARFAVLVVLGLALLAALGLRELERWANRRRVSKLEAGPPTENGYPTSMVGWALVALLAIEYANVPLPWIAAPTLSTRVGAWLRDAPGPGAVLYLPLSIDLENTPVMLEALEHRRPIVNGYSGQRPAFFSGVVDTMQAFPSVEAMWTLKDLDVRYVVTADRIDAAWPLVERARFDEPSTGVSRGVYELMWSDAVEASLGPPAGPAPPPPGPIAYRVGEQLRYRVTWDAPTGTMTAGEVDLAIEPRREAGGAVEPATAPGFRFTVHARTAPWIARFFEADDWFITTADPSLMPLVHERRLREGRRSVDQRFVFDREASRVRAERGNGEAAGPAMRLQPDARDAITALYYVRTLDLDAGRAVDVPIVENGRQSTLAIRAIARETIALGGRPAEALRLEVDLRQRVPRRRPPQITVWLGRDPPRVLLAAEVKAVFGNLRVELTAAKPGS